jgi:excisionase family DNA binding protein
MDDTTEQGLLTKEQAVAYLGGAPITLKTVEALVRRREIGFVKIGRALRFPRTELDAYIEAHTVKPVENSWGLTDASLARVRSDRSPRRGAA